MEKIGVGIVGFGFSSTTFHIPLLQTIDEFDIRAIVSSKEVVVKQALPTAQVVHTIGELVKRDDIDLVVITSPNTTHFPFVKEAIVHGKHVVVEKPFVVSVEEGEELITLAKKHDVIVSVYHNRRFDNDFLTIKKLIEEKQIGNVYTYEAHFDRFRPHVRNRWREKNLPGSGILYDLGSHLIDQALHLFGKPDAVSADIVKQRPGAETDDYFHIVLYYGIKRVILHSSSYVKHAGPHFSVHGDKGSIVKYGMDSQEDQLKAGMKPGDIGYGEDNESDFAVLETEEEVKHIPTEVGCYEIYYKGIRDSIVNGVQPPVTAEEGLQVIQLIKLAIESSETGTVISL
ncbi:oxidoreductase [Bacillus pseudomycoides]|uniref:oxidoreductase n=1 Tax=Bacillus pseudomycoides TaxID=64104 RepID=UPI000BEE1D19|nr:oxidoreductase [Bacillus pseudomycoides]PED06860.1 oxidoreductase [Bacillus pseudomycoides]PEI99734.1 oxidoreductase [Bacillus pseudomycoides]PEK20986.1 oxidoreductase [Bacillus pseudomycoides]PEM76784.1 oxidoreductase [Bacillus pseudomycoides]PEO11036.1 oxidoreductase [Bacillus pseudomycoides]